MLKMSTDNVVGDWTVAGFLFDDYVTVDSFEEQVGYDYTDEITINENGTGSLKVEQDGNVIENKNCTWKYKDGDDKILYFYLEDGTEVPIASYDFSEVSSEPCIARLVEGDETYIIYYKKK